MKTSFASYVRPLLVSLVTIGIAFAASACDWANVGGPW
jgi:hypothetical protein